MISGQLHEYGKGSENMRRILLTCLAFLMVISMDFSVFAQEGQTKDQSLALFIGSPLTISSGVIKALDPDNPNVAPIIHKNRTLVPIRAIAEHFDANVTYDAVNKAAVINYSGSDYRFYIGKNYFTSQVKGGAEVRHSIDTETLIIENRAMVPLRAIIEDVLKLRISYSKNVILAGSNPGDLAINTALRDEIKGKIGQAVKVTSLDQLKSIISPRISTYGPEMQALDTKSNTVQEAAPAVPSPSVSNTPSESSSNGDSGSGTAATVPDYSSTTTQVEGIDEADVVKTDGKFIYIAAGGSVSIIKATEGKMTIADVIKMPTDPRTGQNINISELYIDEGRLVVLGTLWRGDNMIMPAALDTPSLEVSADLSIAIYPPIWRGRNYSYCGVYAIDENGKSDLIKELELEGSMFSSRKSGDTVYITTNKYMYYYYPDYPMEILPMYRDTAAGDDYRSLGVDKIMYYPDSLYPQYLILAALDIRDSEKETTIEAILGSGSTIYMNDSALYIAQDDYNNMGSMTAVTKFSINGTKLGFAGGGKVPGTILNQFSMDEYQGNFRIATTGWNQTSTNAVYILDQNLNRIGAVENLAPGERIYSVRFMGGKGYIVTFRQIDPLFVLNLSDPTAPKVTGELKVPGFSNYLYPIDENILLGVGQATLDIYSRDENGKEIVIGTRQTGIKFSLFDVSDQGKPKELQSFVLGGSGSYSEILYNHKAMMFDFENNLTAFEATLTDLGNEGKTVSDYFNGAVVLTYDAQAGFSVKGRIPVDTKVISSNDGTYYSYIRRLCYIGDVLYYVQDGKIRSFDKNSLKPISSSPIR